MVPGKLGPVVTISEVIIQFCFFEEATGGTGQFPRRELLQVNGGFASFKIINVGIPFLFYGLGMTRNQLGELPDYGK